MGENFIKNCFGESYGISEPISWRYKVDGTFVWLAVSLMNSGLNGNVKIKNSQNGLEVIL